MFLLYIISPIHTYAAENNNTPTHQFKNVNIFIDENGVIDVSGRTQESVEDGTIILVKVFNEQKGLEFFDQVKIYNDRFSLDFIPMNAQLKDKLKLTIVGLGDYEQTFYYEEVHLDEEERIIQETTQLLQQYMSYYDNNISVKLKFNPTVAYNGEVVFVYLNGTNFTEKDIALNQTKCWICKEIKDRP
jgi:hypothetical protein